MGKMRNACIISLIAACLAVPSLLVGETVCHSTADVERFFAANRIGQVPIALTGTVLRVGIDKQITIADELGRLQVHDKDWQHPDPRPGDFVTVRGTAFVTPDNELYTESRQTVPLAHGKLPPIEFHPIRELNASHHLKDVRTKGTVVDAFTDELDPNYTFLILKDGPDELPVAILNQLTTNVSAMLDAEVHVTGVFRRTSSGERKFSGPFICIEITNGVKVVKSPPTNPFHVPKLEKRLYLTPADVARLGKRRTSGEVLAVWNGNRFLLRTADRRVVNVTLAAGQNLPPCGSSVEVVGYPETDSFRMNLGKAVFRLLPLTATSSEEDDVARSGMSEENRTVGVSPTGVVTADDLRTILFDKRGMERIQPSIHGRLLRLTGVIQTLPSAANRDRRLLLSCDSIKITVDPGSTANAFDGLQVGSTVEITGRCLLEVDDWQPGKVFPRISGLTLVIRGPSDIRIVANPPWWTPTRLLCIIAGLFAVLLGFFIWNRILNRLVERRGRALYRAEIDRASSELRIDERTRLAVELHDTLSQNLTGIALAVNAGEYELARKSLKSCREELKNCLWDLRNDALEDQDLNAAIRKTLAPHVGKARVAVRFNLARRQLTDKTTHAILRMLRELAVNAVRHGNATEIRIAGSIKENRVLFSLRDNGCGFDPLHVPGIEDGHFGLQGIRERVENMDGELNIESSPGNGTKVTIWLKSKY